MSNEIVKELEKIAKKHGADKLSEVVESIYCTNKVSTQGDPPVTCPAGYVYSETLKRCIPDIG